VSSSPPPVTLGAYGLGKVFLFLLQDAVYFHFFTFWLRYGTGTFNQLFALSAGFIIFPISVFRGKVINLVISFSLPYPVFPFFIPDFPLTFDEF